MSVSCAGGPAGISIATASEGNLTPGLQSCQERDRLLSFVGGRGRTLVWQ